MPKYTNADGVKVECSEEQAAFLGLTSGAKKAPAKATPPTPTSTPTSTPTATREAAKPKSER